MGSSQYSRYTSAGKDGRPWVAQATDKAAQHHRNTIHTTTFSSFVLFFDLEEHENLKIKLKNNSRAIFFAETRIPQNEDTKTILN